VASAWAQLEDAERRGAPTHLLTELETAFALEVATYTATHAWAIPITHET
jgi:hypothetical protein